MCSVNLDDYDFIIVSHTSPNRIYVKHHPVHANDALHKNSDLIYTDLKEHVKNNKSLQPIIDFYENYFDIEYAEFTHGLLCKQIEDLVANRKVLHLSNLDWKGLYQFNNMLHFDHLFKQHRGLMNHYNDAGNTEVYLAVKQAIGRA